MAIFREISNIADALRWHLFRVYGVVMLRHIIDFHCARLVDIYDKHLMSRYAAMTFSFSFRHYFDALMYWHWWCFIVYFDIIIFSLFRETMPFLHYADVISRSLSSRHFDYITPPTLLHTFTPLMRNIFITTLRRSTLFHFYCGSQEILRRTLLFSHIIAVTSMPTRRARKHFSRTSFHFHEYFQPRHFHWY